MRRLIKIIKDNQSNQKTSTAIVEKFILTQKKEGHKYRV